MGRYRGTFLAAANYEPLIGGPFDARQLVETKSDLTNPVTWRQPNGDVWTYLGMLVVVATDTESNNGVYILINKDYTKEESWLKQANSQDIVNLQQQIDNIETTEGSVSIEVDTMEDLPEVGAADTTYYVKENFSIQRWNEATQSYLSYGNSGDSPELDINLIHGGNANGTD